MAGESGRLGLLQGAGAPGKHHWGAGPTSATSPERARPGRERPAPRPARPARVNTWPSPRTTPMCPTAPARRPAPPAPPRGLLPAAGERRGASSPGARALGAQRAAPPRPGGRPAAARVAFLEWARARGSRRGTPPGTGALPRAPASHSSAAAGDRREGAGRQGGSRQRRASGCSRRRRRGPPCRSSPLAVSRAVAVPPAASPGPAGAADAQPPGDRARRALGPSPRGPAEKTAKFPWHLGAGGGWWDSPALCSVSAGGRAGTGALGWEGALVVAVNSPSGDRPLRLGCSAGRLRAVPVAELGRATHRGEEEPSRVAARCGDTELHGAAGECVFTQFSALLPPFLFLSIMTVWELEDHTYSPPTPPPPTEAPGKVPRVRVAGGLAPSFLFLFLLNIFLNWKVCFWWWKETWLWHQERRRNINFWDPVATAVRVLEQSRALCHLRTRPGLLGHAGCLGQEAPGGQAKPPPPNSSEVSRSDWHPRRA